MSEEKNYWQHRISHCWNYSSKMLKDNGILSIGFSDWMGKNLIGNSNDFEKEYYEVYKDKSRTRNNLRRFLYDMKKGDYVVVPSYRAFSVYEIIDDEVVTAKDLDTSNLDGITKDEKGLLDKDNNHIDLGFFRKVKPITRDIGKDDEREMIYVSRGDYADAALTSRMKYRGTNIHISNIKGSVDDAIDSFKKGEKINILNSILVSTAPHILETIEKISNPDKFEKLVKNYFTKVGATKSDIPAKNTRDKEGDADIIAIFDPIKTIIYIQAKFHKRTSTTDEHSVNQIIDYVSNKDENVHNENDDDKYSLIGWVITTAKKFSDKAIEKASENDIILINGSEFSEMLLRAGISNLE